MFYDFESRLRDELSMANPSGAGKIIGSEENWGFFNNLGDSVVVEILIRLPSDTVIRCKSVCKWWYALISDNGDYFITRWIHHRHQFPADSNSFSLVIHTAFHYMTRKELFHFTSQVDIVSENPFIRQLFKDHIVDMRFIPCAQRPYTFRPVPRDPYVFPIEASCGDLLLFSFNDLSTSTNVYHICNIITRQWIALPPIPMSSDGADVGLLCDPAPCLDCKTKSGFNACYNFKIVRVPLAGLAFVKSHSKLKIQIFSSQRGCWTDSQVSLTRTLKAGLDKTRLITYNRMLHKLTTNGVIVFDPISESSQVSRIIDLPPGQSIDAECCFGLSQGLLCVGKSFKDWTYSSLQVWVLEDYITGKWSLTYSIRTDGLYFQGALVSGELNILSFHPNERNTLYLWLERCIVQYNMQQPEKFEILHHIHPTTSCSLFRFGSCWMNTFLLFHQW